MRNEFVAFALITVLGILGLGFFVSSQFYWLGLIFFPIVILGVYDMFQKENAIVRNFPILGRGRHLMEELRPKIYQYFIESDTNGKPISRIFRSLVYERSKNANDTAPFGTQLDVYEEGYEFVNHSLAAYDGNDNHEEPRVKFGGKHCIQPYEASIFNVSAMSFGSLSYRAVLALNGGAKLGGFAHNTGEGGISDHHLDKGGDLIFQIGTGYFGARNPDGDFSDEKFKENATRPSVRMIEIKLSQGAKPGHGGILPAKKNTAEIARIRGVNPGQDVLSPPTHKAFSDPKGLLQFVDRLRQLSSGKPVGFKLCVGRKSEFIAICKAMIELDIYPDFISVDGGEGGTGAAPLEFTNSVGMPLAEGLVFVEDCLIGFGIRDDIRIIASGKVFSGFHIMRLLALGADACYSARAMMMALGCIQALECNTNTCPTGVATQDKELIAGLNVENKETHVYNYHHKTIHAFKELMGASGIRDLEQIDRSTISKRVDDKKVKTFLDIFPYPEEGCLLDELTVPESWKSEWQKASVDSFITDKQ